MYLWMGDWKLHFQNEVLIDSSKASCAIDSISEPFYYGIFKKASRVQLLSGGLLTPLLQMCKKRNLYNCTSPDMREPLWKYCVQSMPNAFAPKGRFDAEVAEAYRHLGEHGDENMFCVNILGSVNCVDCDTNYTHQHRMNSLLTLTYTSHENGLSGNLQDTVQSEIQNISRQTFQKLYCAQCSRKMSVGDIHINKPDFLILELPVVNGQNVTYPPMVISENNRIFGCTYELTAAVMLRPGHFWSVVNVNDKWIVLDDLSPEIRRYKCFSGAAIQNTETDKAFHIADTEQNNAVHIVILHKTCTTATCEPGKLNIDSSSLIQQEMQPDMTNQNLINLCEENTSTADNPDIVHIPNLIKQASVINSVEKKTFILNSDKRECAYIKCGGTIFLSLTDAVICAGFEKRVKNHGYQPLEKILKIHGKNPKDNFLWNENNTRRMYISFQALICLMENQFCNIKNEIRKNDFLRALEENVLVSENETKITKLSKRSHVKKTLIKLCEDSFQGNKEEMMKSISTLVTKNASRRPFSESGCLSVDDLKVLMKGRIRGDKGSSILKSILKRSRDEILEPMIDPSRFIYIQENFTGFRLGIELRKDFGGLVASRLQVDQYSKHMHCKFQKILQPKRTFSGWSVNVVNLLKMLQYRYPCIDEHSIMSVKIYGDGRQIGGRSTAFFAVSILNNELFFTGHKYQSSDEIFPIAMFYESDKSENLMANGKDVLQNMVNALSGKGYEFYVSGDYNFLMALLDDSLNASSNDKWNIYHKSHKNDRGTVHTSGFRTDLNIPIDNSFPHAVIQGIPITNYVLCIMHGFVRQVEKLLDLEISNILSSGNKAEQMGGSRAVFIEEAIATMESNINKRGVRNGNFEIHFDNTGQPKPVKLNGTHAHVIMSPVPDGCSEDEFPHPLSHVLSKQKKLQMNLAQNVLEKLQLERELSEFEMVKDMWNHLYLMQDILNKDPLPRLKQGKNENSHNINDYEWSYSEADIQLYKYHAEVYFQLFRMRYGWQKLTPYMILYIDHVPTLMSHLPYSLARFMAQGGEHLNYRDNNYFYNHTLRHGGRKTVLQDPIYATLFHRFKNLCYDIDQFRYSNNPGLRNTGQMFSNFLHIEENTEDLDYMHSSPANESAKEIIFGEQLTPGIFSGKYFVLVGNIQQAKLKKIITNNGGCVSDDLPAKLSVRAFTVVTYQAAVGKNPSRQIRLAVRKGFPIVSVDYIYESVNKDKVQNTAEFSLNLKTVKKLVKSRDLLLKEKHFSNRSSMLSLLKKAQRKALSDQKVQKTKKHKIYKNPATYYAMTRRKYFGQRMKTFEESRALNKFLMAEWKKLTPRSKKRSTLDWKDHVEHTKLKETSETKTYSTPKRLCF